MSTIPRRPSNPSTPTSYGKVATPPPAIKVNKSPALAPSTPTNRPSPKGINQSSAFTPKLNVPVTPSKSLTSPISNANRGGVEPSTPVALGAVYSPIHSAQLKSKKSSSADEIPQIQLPQSKPNSLSEASNLALSIAVQLAATTQGQHSAENSARLRPNSSRGNSRRGSFSKSEEAIFSPTYKIQGITLFYILY